EPQGDGRPAGQRRFGGVEDLAEARAGAGTEGGQPFGQADGLDGGGRAHVVAPVPQQAGRLDQEAGGGGVGGGGEVPVPAGGVDAGAVAGAPGQQRRRPGHPGGG